MYEHTSFCSIRSCPNGNVRVTCTTSFCSIPSIQHHDGIHNPKGCMEYALKAVSRSPSIIATFTIDSVLIPPETADEFAGPLTKRIQP